MISERADNFFRWVWRLNGLFILVGIVGLLVAVAIGVFTAQGRPEQLPPDVAGMDLRQKDLRLGDFSPVPGTELLYAQLGPQFQAYGSGNGSVHNLLFFNTATRNVHWLLPTNDQTIEVTFLTDPVINQYRFVVGNDKKQDPVTLAILIESQSNDEGVNNLRSLAVATPDGKTTIMIAESIDRVLGNYQPRKDSVLVFFVAGGSVRVLDFDPIARAVRSNEPLSTGGQSSVLPN